MLTGIVVGLSIYVALILTRSFFRVEEGEVAVLSSFGGAVRAEGGTLRTFSPGVHFKLPWQKVHTASAKEQCIELTGEKGARTAMAEDGTILRIDSILRYEPVRDRLESLLFDLRAPVEHITGLFTCLLRNEIANFRPGNKDTAPRPEEGSYALLRRERRALNREIEAFCKHQIGERYGVRFNAVDLTELHPPDDLADALNAMIQARNEAETMYARAEADSQQRSLAAERGVAIARARAVAAEREIETLGGFLSELARNGMLSEYVERRRAEVLAQSKTLFLRSAS
jgi:regulator of protease activity HflC (stomatin/prohibitin superfamily)